MKKKTTTKQRRAQSGTLSQPPQWLYESLAGPNTASGMVVNESTALNLSVVWACVRVVSETVASLPWFVYQKDTEGGRNKAEDHEIYSILHDSPNPDMTAFTWKEVSAAHALTWGNCYSEIIRGRRDRVAALYPIEPHRVAVKRRQNGEIFYEISNGGAKEPTKLEAYDVLHVPGLGFDGLVGYSVIKQARESLGLTSAAEQLGASFFGNGAHMGGTLEHPGKLTDAARKNLRESVNAVHKGAKNAGKFMILEEGMKYARTGIPPEDAQFLETRQFQVEEVCRWFRVPPHKVQHLLRSTFSNIEHQSIEFVTDTIRPWLIRFEQEANRKLLRPSEKGTVYTEHQVDALLRGDALSRSQALEIQLRNGVRLIDEWRSIENLNPLPDGLGKKPLVTVNTVPLDMAGQQPEPTPADPATDQLQRHLAGIRATLGDAAAEREARRLAEVISKNLGDEHAN